MDFSKIELFLLDMDGTIYLDHDLIDGSLDFINALIATKKKYIFMTNNSSKSKKAYLDKLNFLKIPCQEENIFTSGMAMGIYLNTNYPDKTVYFLGTKSLEEELKSYHITLVEDNPDIVVVGYDRELTYHKLEKACQFLDDGAIFLATNCDLVCPIANHRYVPDCGSICHMLTTATKKTPTYIGKPSPYMIHIISQKTGIKVENIVVIGDRIYTDIMAGYNAKTMTICVLSGESTQATIDESPIKPDYVVNSIKDLIKFLK